MARQVEALATGRTAVAQALRSAGADRNLSNFIGNNIAVSGLGSSQVIDLTVTLVPRWRVAQRRRPGSPSADEPGMAACPDGTLAGRAAGRDAAGMRIAVGAGSEVLGTPVRPQDIVGDVVAAEADGFRSAWTVHFSRGVDALGVLAVAGTQTSQIDLGVGIVPTYPRHPLALAQQAATAQAFCGGRLTLGVGVSHRPVIEDLHGLAYQQPAAHMRDYLSVLVPLLREGTVRYHGTFYRVDGGFTVPGTSPVAVLVGALSPLMVQAAGELADGVVTWLAGPRTLGEDIIPRLHRAAGNGAAAAQPAPRVVAALPVALTASAGTARQAADEVFARYAGFDNYRRLLEREGAATPGALAVTGTEAGIEKQLMRLAGLGVTELWPIIFPVGDDPVRSRRETRALLRDLATAEPGTVSRTAGP